MDRELEIFVRSQVGELHALGQVVQVVDAKRARAENRRPGYGLLFTSLEDDQRAFIGLTLDAIEREQRAQAKARETATPAARLRTSVKPAKTPSGVQPSKAPAPAASIRPATPSAPPPAEQAQIVAELRAELTKLQGKTAWTALGLDADAPLSAAKEAFLRMSKRFHPHKFARHDSLAITKLATEVFIAYKRAYSVLTKLAPRGPGAPERARRAVSSIAPTTAATSLRPDTSKPAGHRPRSR
jgi:hypothetical protein